MRIRKSASGDFLDSCSPIGVGDMLRRNDGFVRRNDGLVRGNDGLEYRHTLRIQDGQDFYRHPFGKLRTGSNPCLRRGRLFPNRGGRDFFNVNG